MIPEWIFWVYGIGWFLALVLIGYMAVAEDRGGKEVLVAMLASAFWPLFIPVLIGVAVKVALDG